MEQSTREIPAVTLDQLAALRSVCERLAHVCGTTAPPDLDSLPGIIAALSSLSATCGKQLARWRQDEEALRDARHELDHVERLKARFIRHVSHELRTPLASIDGFAKALLQMEQQPDAGTPKPDGVSSPADTRRQFLSIISQEAQRLGKLIEDVLDLSDIESDRRHREPGLFSASALFRDTLAWLKTGPHGPRVIVRLNPDGEGPSIYADREAMVEVLRQLLSNADKFSGGQDIVLGAELVSIGPDRRTQASESGLQHRVSSATQLYVKDTGIGIPKAELSRVFDKFYRGEGVAAAFPGTGLGLAVVRTLVNQNNGQVWADSGPSRGSTFYVLLPNRPPGH
ncbi:MAG: HAMP domain-containing sensor histidine kinase [Planctomycetota bacterium]|nr:HAMP domain-containing sensor histidine kinase [Planctomycetota bacterium]